jgi:hypothetical protein
MELSAMLGENVDLSEARALFAAGRTDEAFGVLKSSGVLEKAQSQGLFGTQALSAALGGMDLSQLAAGTYEKGPKAGIVSNQQFLDTFTEAMRTLNVENATISAKFALLATGIDTKELKTLYSGDVNAMMVGLQAQQIQNQAMGQIMIGAAEKINMVTQGAKLTAAGAGGLTGTAGYFTQLNTYNMGYMGGQGLSYGNLKPGGIGVNQSVNTPAVNVGVPMTTNVTTGTNFTTGMTQGIDNSNTKKSIDVQSSTMVKILDRNHKSMLQLEQLNTSTNTMVNLTKDIRALTAVMSGLSTDNVMKLVLDGKELKTRIEKIQTQEKGKTKS